MKDQLLCVQSIESGFSRRALTGSVDFGSTVASAFGAVSPASYVGTSGLGMAEAMATATHATGLACSPCAVAMKQDRKNNWHGRPLIGRGGIG